MGETIKDDSIRGAADRLIVFTRCPEPGKVKTRLISGLGAYGAARLQREMTRHILWTVAALAPDIDREVHYDQGNDSQMRNLYGNDLRLRQQVGDDLGRRMLHAFRTAFAEGARRVVLIGSDCPLISPEILKSAFERLANCPCALGPAEDGGYYLIGLTRPEETLFQGIAWGTSSVLAQTLEKARKTELAVTLLQTLPDIDRPENIGIWKAALKFAPPRIAAIIPTLNESAAIVATLESLAAGRDVEIIVADGVSTDATVELAQAHGALVVSTGKGRARQCNAGAACASADILLFLHADTRVQPGYDHAIRIALADARTAAGAFTLAFDRRSVGMNVIAMGANLRSRILGLPYGDQGLFLWSADFRDLGGFPDLTLMDDAVFISKLKERGRIVTVAPTVITAARRYERLGILPTWLINQCVLIGFHLGVHPDELARLYHAQAGLSAWITVMAGAQGRRGSQKKEKSR